MKKVLVEELKPGMRFNQPVYIDSSNVLVGANVAIQEADIKRLMKWGIKEITTEGELVTAAASAVKSTNADIGKIIDSYNKLLLLKDKLIDVHTKACNAVAKVYTSIKNNHSFPSQDINNSVESMINILAENQNVFIFLYGLGEQKDPMAVHSVNTCFYSLIIASAMKYNRVKLKEIGIGTIMINAGMVQIPHYILYKDTNLSEQELTQIKKHPILGYQALKNLGNFSESMAVVSLQHHEYYNGKGYPRNLVGNAIAEYARIATIADNYEAMLEKRNYREKQFFYDAMKELVHSGAGKFDPVILRVFIAQLSAYPIGSIVQLNQKGVGLVIGSVPNKPMRPIIKMLKDETGTRVKELRIINLVDEPSIYIVKILDEKEAGIRLSDLF